MKLIQQISLFSFCIFIFFIPFNYAWSNLFWFISVFFLLVDKDLYKSFSLKKISNEEKYFLLISTFYFIYFIISLFWTENLMRGFQLIGRYIILISFPWFMSFLKSIGIVKNNNFLFWIFTIGVFFSSFVCLYLSYQNCWQETESGLVFETHVLDKGCYRDNILDSISEGYNFFSYSFLSHFIHPSYYSLYFLFSVIFMVRECKNMNNYSAKLFLIALILYSLAFIYMLQSRANLIALLLVGIIFVLYYTIQKKKYFVLILGLLISIFITTKVVQNSRLSWIISNTIEAFNSDTSELRTDKLEHNVNDRIIIWQNALQVIKEHPILGVGIGDTDTELENQYKKNGVDFTFGTHNQYIYAQLSMGILGLLLLLAILFVPIYYGIKNRYFPLIGFSVAVMINLMFENMLTRNAGLMFIPWATMLLLMMSEEKKNELAK